VQTDLLTIVPDRTSVAELESTVTAESVKTER